MLPRLLALGVAIVEKGLVREEKEGGLDELFADVCKRIVSLRVVEEERGEGRSGREERRTRTYRRDDRGLKKASVGPPLCTASKLLASTTGLGSANTESVPCETRANQRRRHAQSTSASTARAAAIG